MMLSLMLFYAAALAQPCLNDSYNVRVTAAETHVKPGQRINLRYEIVNYGHEPFYAPRFFPPVVARTPRMQIFWTDLRTAKSEQQPGVHAAFPDGTPKLRIADQDGMLVDPGGFVGREFPVFAPRKSGNYRLELDPWSWECSDISSQQLGHPALAGRLKTNSLEITVDETKSK
jgi:hypothetical protein